MARFAREKNATRSLAIPVGADAETDATPRAPRAPARNRSNRSLVKNRRRLHRRTFRASRAARRRTLRSGAPTGLALRARTNFKVRNPAKTETTLRRQNHPRRPLSCGLSLHRGKLSLMESEVAVVTAAGNPLLTLLAASAHTSLVRRCGVEGQPRSMSMRDALVRDSALDKKP
jgi:hypothetical protein